MRAKRESREGRDGTEEGGTSKGGNRGGGNQ